MMQNIVLDIESYYKNHLSIHAWDTEINIFTPHIKMYVCVIEKEQENERYERTKDIPQQKNKV